jgi:hypothetical protein
LATLKVNPKGEAALKECDLGVFGGALFLGGDWKPIKSLSKDDDGEACLAHCGPDSPLDALTVKSEGVAVLKGAS